MDDESECDWSPPIEVDVVESEIFEIPSGLPSIEDFIKQEQEKEDATKPAEDDTDETVLETHEEDELPTTIEVPLDDTSIAGDHDDFGEIPAVTVDDVISEDDFEIPPVEIKKPKVKTKKKVTETFGIETVLIDFDSIKRKAIKEDEENRRMKLIDSTNDFIIKLIGDVVETCEYEDPDDILRARLDKDRVCEELIDKMYHLDIEQKIRLFLNRKIVEYFRRKKATRPLIDDNPDNIINQLRKYRKNLTMVNRYMALEKSTEELVKNKIIELKKELVQFEKKSTKESNEFVENVKNILEAENSDRMEALIENLTRKMHNMEKEISKVKFVLIQRQNAMAGLQEKAKKLEDLGNGLRMIDFEHLQTETQALGKKIEERNNELNRLHSRCNADIHTLAHIREKQQMVRNTILVQQETFDELIEEKQSCREFLNGLKIERGSIRRELQKISFQNGLLDKPDLLLDLDATEEKVNNLQAKLNSVKSKQLIVDEKLKQMMKMIQE